MKSELVQMVKFKVGDDIVCTEKDFKCGQLICKGERFTLKSIDYENDLAVLVNEDVWYSTYLGDLYLNFEVVI